jgi:hypothetical protein
VDPDQFTKGTVRAFFILRNLGWRRRYKVSNAPHAASLVTFFRSGQLAQGVMESAVGLVTLWGALALISQILITSSIFTFEHSATAVWGQQGTCTHILMHPANREYHTTMGGIGVLWLHSLDCLMAISVFFYI